MRVDKRLWLGAVSLAAATSFLVFYLPFLLPPKPISGLSASNLAGFNNKIAAIGAALCSMAAISFLYLRQTERSRHADDDGHLGQGAVACFTVLCCSFTALIGAIVLASDSMYPSDFDYFVQQMSAHAIYGRHLYSEIEFGYGPLLFYLPLFVRDVLSAFHLSIRSAFLVSIVLAQATGMYLLAYLINALRMAKQWRLVAFAILGLQSAQLNLSLNYQLVRFIVPASFLVFTSRRQRLSSLAFSLLAGQIVSMAVSPEMGVAFLVGGVTYALLRFIRDQREVLLWIATLPIVGASLFLGISLASGGGYLRTILLFSHGVLGLVVQPVPYILVFLFALVWLVPWLLATELRSNASGLPLLGALYASTLGLLPVAFGRADPTHVLMNGIVVYLLAFAAISKTRRWQQSAWVAFASAIILFTFVLNSRVYVEQLRMTIPGLRTHPGLQRCAYRIARVFRPATTRDVFLREPPATIDIATLKRRVGDGKIIVPIPLSSRLIETQLSRAGLFMPTFYYGFDNQLDRDAEIHGLAEFNQAQWALLPEHPFLSIEERPDVRAPIGPQFLHRVTHSPYIVGRLFADNLKARWIEVEQIPDGYILYRKR